MEDLTKNLLDYIEPVAIGASLIYILFNARLKRFSWIYGAIGASLYVIVFTRSGLYGSAILSAFYFFFMGYGWFMWRANTPRPLTVTLLTSPQRLVSIITGGLLTVAVFTACNRFFDAIPVQDAVIMGYGFVAQFLAARKKLESWIGWIALNALAVHTYITYDLKATAMLYVAYLLFSLYGLWQWRRQSSMLRKHATDSV